VKPKVNPKFNSRKFLLTSGVVLILAAIALGAYLVMEEEAQVSGIVVNCVLGISGVASIYLGSNAATNYVGQKFGNNANKSKGGTEVLTNTDNYSKP